MTIIPQQASIGLFAAMFGFFSAFIVSMFDTPSTHDALIAVSSALVLYECRPPCNRCMLWNIHWWSTVTLCVVFVTWLVFSTSCDSLFCEECSWWYISEYLFFWSMFLLVYWRIPEYSELIDTIPFDASSEDESQAVLATSSELQF